MAMSWLCGLPGSSGGSGEESFSDGRGSFLDGVARGLVDEGGPVAIFFLIQ